MVNHAFVVPNPSSVSSVIRKEMAGLAAAAMCPEMERRDVLEKISKILVPLEYFARDGTYPDSISASGSFLAPSIGR